MDKNRNLKELHDAGVSIWLDTLSRDLLTSGRFASLVRDHSVTGATSNPTIFAKALGSDAYDEELRALAEAGVRDPREIFFRIALEDVRAAAAELRPAYDASSGADGFVSFEVTPDLAGDTEGTIEQALELWSRLDLPNVMIKVPATPAGVPAIEELTARGVNVNVTLLFSVARYAEVIEAYVRGLERRVATGLDVSEIASVASFFVSRVDTKASPLLPAGEPLHCGLAVANARAAYELHREWIGSDRWRALAEHGARPQRPLWASTGTKDPFLSDTHYVESLVQPGVVNTMPLKTLQAFADHGKARPARREDVTEARQELARAADRGIDLEAIAAELEREGVAAFCDSYSELLGRIQSLSSSMAARTSSNLALNAS